MTWPPGNPHPNLTRVYNSLQGHTVMERAQVPLYKSLQGISSSGFTTGQARAFSLAQHLHYRSLMIEQPLSQISGTHQAPRIWSMQKIFYPNRPSDLSMTAASLFPHLYFQ
ncbi:uncharacterized protein LOC131217592 [Magnolia sinica]|uniref:uncharacterized protein LOC131217592 n=1 Tax=Magnolia sinica TaxID=86752 RepID=UPI00265A4BAE|nr:uncharacterized protein LOC131217592 [Magnolia sinica]